MQNLDPILNLHVSNPAKIKLSEDTYDKRVCKYHFKVIPPLWEPVYHLKYTMILDADLVFYDAKKLDNFDVNKIPYSSKIHS